MKRSPGRAPEGDEGEDDDDLAGRVRELRDDEAGREAACTYRAG